MSRLLLLLSVLLGTSLLFYSYTQVDLGLTLTQAGIWQSIQKGFQYIGYFNRPISAGLYLIILAGLFIQYGAVLFLAARKRLSERNFRIVLLVFAGLAVFSYPAFSKDLFNYMFTAKTVLVYHKNPYTVIPLQFSGVDPWLSFLHWTHLPSAYTPLWILLTLPVYLMGFGIFLITMWNFKLLAFAFYLGTVWLIGEVIRKQMPGKEIVSMALFAFNPLVIIEVIINGHNDIAMMFFAVLALYLYDKRMRWSSLLALGVSAGFKTMTAFLFPAVAFRWNRVALLGLAVLSVVLVATQREILPWYLLWVMPFVALFPDRKEPGIIAAGVSMGLLLRYAPFLYYGHWNYPVQEYIFWGGVIPSVFGLVIAAVVYKFVKYHTK